MIFVLCIQKRIHMLTKEEFDLLKSRQYCDNPTCSCFNQVGVNNIRINSRPKGQVYCNKCRNIWVLTKGTIFFDLRTPIKKVIETLQLLVRGMGFNNTCRTAKVSPGTVLEWIEKAANHSNEFTEYMQQNMNLEQVQIDEFWSFIRKKRKTLQQLRNSYPK